MLCYSLEEWGKVSYSLQQEHITTPRPWSTEILDKILQEHYSAVSLWPLIPERWVVIKFADKRYRTLFILKHP